MKRSLFGGFGGSFWRMASPTTNIIPSTSNSEREAYGSPLIREHSGLFNFGKSQLQFKPMGVPITNLTQETNQLLENMIRLQTFGKSIIGS